MSSQLIYPEARAAVAMAERIGRLDKRASRKAVGAIDKLYTGLLVIGVDDALARSAGDLAEQHGLRGYDAVHLASVIAVQDPLLVTVTWDSDLAKAALACGRAVAP